MTTGGWQTGGRQTRAGRRGGRGSAPGRRTARGSGNTCPTSCIGSERISLSHSSFVQAFEKESLERFWGLSAESQDQIYDRQTDKEKIFIELMKSTLNFRRPKRARGSTGPKRLHDTRCETCKPREEKIT